MIKDFNEAFRKLAKDLNNHFKQKGAKMKSKITTAAASDYCIAECSGYYFYYGYEETSCPFHKTQDECEAEDCINSVWNFVAKKDNKEIYRSVIENSYDDFSYKPLVIGILEMVEKGLFK